eukprot:TRINITY_DN2915_c0_g1_i1.p4 TRINITY_DN2915_c0_g1~~TRINITY_DN2915_c0_g1_i1.p4  ORF type:complete len:131 (+),score=55.77 TRINITY_DN2915_c0_g1_i1:83-475(+)
MGDERGGDEDEDGEARQQKRVRAPRKIHVKDSDMLPDLQDAAIEFIQQALDELKMPKDIAQYVKQKMDEEKRGVWHVIVGAHFACNTTHDAETFLNCSVFPVDGQAIGPIGEMVLHVLMFRNGPPIKSDE